MNGRNGGDSGWPAGGYFRFSPQVAVDPDAPNDTTLPRGNGSFRYTNPGSGTLFRDTLG